MLHFSIAFVIIKSIMVQNMVNHISSANSSTSITAGSWWSADSATNSTKADLLTTADAKIFSIADAPITTNAGTTVSLIETITPAADPVAANARTITIAPGSSLGSDLVIAAGTNLEVKCNTSIHKIIMENGSKLTLSYSGMNVAETFSAFFGQKKAGLVVSNITMAKESTLETSGPVKIDFLKIEEGNASFKGEGKSVINNLIMSQGSRLDTSESVTQSSKIIQNGDSIQIYNNCTVIDHLIMAKGSTLTTLGRPEIHSISILEADETFGEESDLGSEIGIMGNVETAVASEIPHE